MKLFNSMTNKKEEFIPIKEDEVSIYVCGPTVYNHAHIGNTRPLIIFDVLRRVLEYRGKKVIFVSNFTDVDDKIIKAAKAEGIDERVLAQRYIDAYNAVRDELNLLHPTYTPRVTETMDQIIAFIDDLVKKGFAYEKDGDVYFRVEKIEEYGHLSGIRIEDLLNGASNRVEENGKKESPVDFALWKKTEEGIQFDSPWSKGRPGWHTECVVMINDLFEGGKIDIHGGGQDLKFPHHENEIAQSMACHHHPIANYWVHNQMINIDNAKMSKSLGNVMWAKDLIPKLGINVYKWVMMSTHYRNPLNYTEDLVSNVRKEVDKVSSVIKQISLWMQVSHIAPSSQCNPLLEEMIEALEDDLNTSLALSKVLEAVKGLNQLYRQKEKDVAAIAKLYHTLLMMLEVFGFKFEIKTLTDEDIDLYQQWQNSKAVKDFEKADGLRSQLIERGIL